jgi:hypothetical protein
MFRYEDIVLDLIDVYVSSKSFFFVTSDMT